MTATMRPRRLSTKQLRSSQVPKMRRAIIKRLTAKTEPAVRSMLQRMDEEAIARVADGKPPIAFDAIDRWTENWIESQRGILGYVAIAGAKQVRNELGLTKALGEDFRARPDLDAPLYIGQSADDFVLATIQTPVDEWLGEVASASTRAQAAKIESIWHEVAAYLDVEKKQGLTVGQMAQMIKKAMPQFTLARARMIAYTDTNWAFNSGIKTQYKQLGVTVLEWMTSHDDAVCNWCRQMDGVRVKIDDPFWPADSAFGVEVDDGDGGKKVRVMKLPHEVQHPPLHPNCACILLSVLA